MNSQIFLLKPPSCGNYTPPWSVESIIPKMPSVSKRIPEEQLQKRNLRTFGENTSNIIGPSLKVFSASGRNKKKAESIKLTALVI
jgi:hypothetical protein